MRKLGNISKTSNLVGGRAWSPVSLPNVIICPYQLIAARDPGLSTAQLASHFIPILTFSHINYLKIFVTEF